MARLEPAIYSLFEKHPLIVPEFLPGLLWEYLLNLVIIQQFRLPDLHQRFGHLRGLQSANPR
jgi:hypothetical protein